jgi:Sec-independent protein translocase protein TatA
MVSDLPPAPAGIVVRFRRDTRLGVISIWSMVFILVFGLLLFGSSLSNARIRSEVAKGSGEFLSNVRNMVETTHRRVGGRSKSLAI